MPRLFLTFLAALLTLSVNRSAPSVHAQTNGSPERYTATAVNMNRGASGIVEFAVNRWSTQAEHDRLMSTLLEKGPDKLLDVLQDMPRVGYLRTPDSIGWDLHYAHKTSLPDGGERVVLLTDRRIGFWEAAHQPRSIDYPFTFIEIHFNGDGEGQGKLSVATKIVADKEDGVITLENYDIQPVMLTSVKRESPTR